VSTQGSGVEGLEEVGGTTSTSPSTILPTLAQKGNIAEGPDNELILLI
jgi:hypothetical protein